MIHELVYTSRATNYWVSRLALDELLTQARLKNQRLGITGVLLYENGEFVQLLEGEQQAVRDLYYGTIALDPRHRRTFVCWEQAKQERSFADWQMGFARSSLVAADNLPVPDGFLSRGLKELDLSGPRSTGRDLLLSLYESMATHQA